MIAMRPLRSFLFMPVTSDRFIEKARHLDLDAVVLDLEDAIPVSEKDRARNLVAGAASRLCDTACRCFVRVNGPLSPWFQADLLAVRDAVVDGIVVPKVESSRDIEMTIALTSRASQGFGAAEARPVAVIAGIESLAGVVELERILSRTRLEALYFGAEDIAAELGLGREEAPDLGVARANVAFVARRHGVTPIDRAVIAVRDATAFEADAAQGKALGYTGKICLTPGQATIARAIFTPSPSDMSWARDVVAGYRAACAEGHCAIMIGEVFVDEAIAQRAIRILSSAGEAA